MESDNATSSSSQFEPDYTSKQLVHINRIQRWELWLWIHCAYIKLKFSYIFSCKDYYEILQVSKDANDSEIKKAYKKLALILHPGSFPIKQRFSCTIIKNFDLNFRFVV